MRHANIIIEKTTMGLDLWGDEREFWVRILFSRGFEVLYVHTGRTEPTGTVQYFTEPPFRKIDL
jgi:hypothetical protein